ncbi:MAG: hypothetical protein V4463_04445 [Pseudomonadota bacterium]
MIDDLTHSQSDMRTAYCSGGAGILASGIAWLVAAIIAFRGAPQQAVWALFIGGMLIHPAGVLICKLLGSPGVHAKANPLGSLAWASTFWLIFSLPLAYVASLQRIEWFFPAMLLVIGGRYLVFSSLYGMRTYWFLGLLLAATGFLLGRAMAPPAMSACAGAAIEIVFGVAVLFMHRRWARTNNAFAPAPIGGAA